MTTDIRKLKIWLNTDNMAAKQAEAWKTSNPEGAKAMKNIAAVPAATWLTGSSTGSYLASMLKKAEDREELGVFVFYNIPDRDLGNHSSQKQKVTVSMYKAQVDDLANAIDGRLCFIFLEPDGLAMMGDIENEKDKTDRYDCLNYAVDKFMAAGAYVYLDAGDSNWIPTDIMAERLIRAGVKRARGFVLNISHFESTKNEAAYAKKLRAILGNGVRWCLDRSRNAQKTREMNPGEERQVEWCNMDGAGYGESPTMTPSPSAYPGCDGMFWIKGPIASDGEREGQPPAGKPYPQYALRMYYAAKPPFPRV